MFAKERDRRARGRAARPGDWVRKGVWFVRTADCGSRARQRQARSRRRNLFASPLNFCDQLQQMAVLHFLDPVGQDYKLAIDLIQFAPLERVTELFAAQRQRMTS